MRERERKKKGEFCRFSAKEKKMKKKSEKKSHLTPVDQPQLPLDRVDHHVVRLDVAVHDPPRVAKVERLEQFENVKPDVGVGERRVEDLEVCGGDVLEDERRGLGRRVAHAVEQRDDVGAAAQVLQDLDLALDFFFLDRLEDLDHAALARRRVDPFEDLGVLASADLAHDLVVVLGAVVGLR